jgi:hypothetical protein
MLLDFGQLSQEIESVSGLKPLPQRSFVEDYIKAYYLPEICLESWAKQHQASNLKKNSFNIYKFKEYTTNQITTLLAHASKKTKSRF